jgi:hypothetical protein
MTGEEETLRELIAAWDRVDAEVRGAESRRFNLEQEISSVMERLGATERVEGDILLTLRSRNLYDQAYLAPLYELLDEDEREACLTPEKPPPARKWNLTKIKPLAKRGGEIAKVIDSSRYEEPARLKLARLNGGK